MVGMWKGYLPRSPSPRHNASRAAAIGAGDCAPPGGGRRFPSQSPPTALPPCRLYGICSRPEAGDAWPGAWAAGCCSPRMALLGDPAVVGRFRVLARGAGCARRAVRPPIGGHWGNGVMVGWLAGALTVPPPRPGLGAHGTPARGLVAYLATGAHRPSGRAHLVLRCAAALDRRHRARALLR